MRMPRFRIWWAMLLVAVIAVACLPVVRMERVARFRRLQQFHQNQLFVVPRQLELPPALRRDRREWHFQMHKKYRYAADHPWLQVEPDPPAPE